MINDPVPLGLVHECSLEVLLSGKAGNTRAGNSPRARTVSEHQFLLFHPLTLIACANGWLLTPVIALSLPQGY